MRFGRILKLFLLSADEIAVGLFLFFILPRMGIDVPLPISIALIAFLVFKDALIAPYVLEGELEKRPEVGPEALLGLEVTVVEDLSPEGLVKIGGELWSAECVNGSARKGEVVKIVGVSSARVLVERRAS